MLFGCRWRAPIVVFFVSWGFVCSSFAAPVQRITLDNGLSVLLKSVARDSKTLDLRLIMDFGASDERPGERGWAHLIEHMAFSGTKNFSSKRIRALFRHGDIRFGRDVNAATDDHHTVYQLSVHEGDRELLRQNLELIADWLSNMQFSSDALAREKRVIAAESLETLGQREVALNWQEVLLQHPRGEYAAIGDMAEIEQATPQALQAFWRRGYSPEAATLLLTGDFIPSEVARMVQQILAPLGKANKSPNVANSQALPVALQPWVIAPSDDTQVMLAKLVSGAEQKQQTALALMAIQMNMLASEPQLQCGTTHRRLLPLSQESELQYLQLSAEPGSELRCLRAVTATVQHLSSHGVSEAFALRLFHRIQSERQKHRALERVVEVKSLANQLEQRLRKGASAITTADRFTQLSDWISVQDFESISESVLSALNPDNLSLIVQSSSAIKPSELQALWKTDGPVSQTVKVATSYQLADPVSNAPQDLIKESEFQHTLHYANGVRVHLLKTDNVREHFDVLLVRDGGLLSLPSTLVSAAVQLPATLQRHGLAEDSAAVVRAGLHEHKLTLNWFVENFRQGIRASSRGHGAKALFSMLYQAQFELPEASYQQMQQRARQSLQSKDEDGLRQLRRVIWRTLYGLGEAALPPVPVELEAQNYREAHRRLFAGTSGLNIYVAGDFDMHSMRELSDQYFGGLPESEIASSVPGLYASAKRQRIVHRGNVPARADMSFYYVQSASNKLEKFDAELLLMREVLAQRLWEVLREREGLSYDVSLQLQRRAYQRGGSSLKVSMVCDPNLAASVRKHVDEVLLSLLLEGVDATELQTLRQRLTADYQSLLADNASLLDEWANQRERGRSLVQVLRTVAEIEAVDAERLQQFARLFFKETGFLEVNVVPGLQATLSPDQAAFVTEP